MIVLLGIVMGIWREFFAFIRISYQYTVTSGYDEMNICFLLSVILAAALTLAILIPVRDGVEDMKAAKRDLAIIEIVMREKEDERQQKDFILV